ncbi:hypothetical protein VSS74_17135 [Conexibacter stalactiti]|uniref:PKD domain-containing protein n=1 Tax=Conexibacter stalactiti TaxID=1940611 RepID=A0ABU4HVI2_9ACTN|nr:hypothetical protein [Conexibacter stalactiti]MDW5596074.1 hypothetical protein [Conexibacter stalactiti]MEC5036716.1 hypothetical protein [Conexibacter stalactiti]
MRRHVCAAILLAAPPLALALPCAPAHARVEGALPIDGPDAAIGELGGVAMAEDGSGGLVYRRFEEGRAHIYAARYDGRRWYPPQRVDIGQRFDSNWPRIAAADGGRLVVVWTQDGPPNQDSLHSAVLPRRATRFLAPTLIDWTIGEARATHPSLAIAPSGSALLAYRAISTFDLQTLPGYVRGEIRLARFDGWRWQKLGAPVNRNRLAPQRAPTAANSPQVTIAPDGRGAVAWQEPDDQLIDRIWARRVFDTRTGVVLQASPATLDSRPVGSHADALAIDMTAFGRVVVVSRQLPDARDRAAAPRIFVNELPESTDDNALRFAVTGPQPADGAGAKATVPPGPPSLSLGGRTSLLVAFPRAGATALAAGEDDSVADLQSSGGDPVPSAGEPPAPAIDAGAANRGTYAYASPEGGGRVIVQQLDGARVVATQPVAGPQGGPIRSIAVAGSGTGDALVAFAQGEDDEGQIAVARVTAPPVPFAAQTPGDWTRAREPLVTWDPAPPGFRPRSYTLELDGRAVARTTRFGYRFREGALADGAHEVRVVATNAVGEASATDPRPLRTDRVAPTAIARVDRRGRRVVVTIDDGRRGTVAGPAPQSSSIVWGDGRRDDDVSARRAHSYRRAGTYRLVVRALDAAGNLDTIRLTVRAPRGAAARPRRTSIG